MPPIAARGQLAGAEDPCFPALYGATRGRWTLAAAWFAPAQAGAARLGVRAYRHRVQVVGWWERRGPARGGGTGRSQPTSLPQPTLAPSRDGCVNGPAG